MEFNVYINIKEDKPFSSGLSTNIIISSDYNVEKLAELISEKIRKVQLEK